jgi:hypothetical protein
MHLGVLRVLTEQTLEISSVVKDPTQPGPSLVTEVKDSPHHSTSVLSQSQVDSTTTRFREKWCASLGVSSRRAHLRR